MKKIFLAFLVLSLSVLMGCSPSADDNRKTDNEEFRRLQKAYDTVSGAYAGKLITTQGQEISVLLRLNVGTEEIGRNADGTKKVVPVLNAIYDQANLTGCTNLKMSVKYTPETGDLFIYGKEPTTGVSDYNLNTRLAGDSITGALASEGWFNGRVTLTKLAVGNNGVKSIVNERKKFFQSLAGSYELQITPRSGNSSTSKANIDIWANSSTGVDEACVYLSGTAYFTLAEGPASAQVGYQAYTNTLSVSNANTTDRIKFSLTGLMDSKGHWAGDGYYAAIMFDFKTLSKK